MVPHPLPGYLFDAMSTLPTPDEGMSQAAPMEATPKPSRRLDDKLADIEQENRHLLARLRQAELILDIQEKTLKLFGVKPKPSPDEPDASDRDSNSR